MVECTLSVTHCLRLNLQLHTIDLVSTCRISSFCTVAWQLARFQLTRRIARSLGDSWASCFVLPEALCYKLYVGLWVAAVMRANDHITGATYRITVAHAKVPYRWQWAASCGLPLPKLSFSLEGSRHHLIYGFFLGPRVHIMKKHGVASICKWLAVGMLNGNRKTGNRF